MLLPLSPCVYLQLVGRYAHVISLQAKRRNLPTLRFELQRKYMMTPKRSTQFLALLISSALLAAPAAAQQPKSSAPQKETTRADSHAPAPTLDTLLATDSYKVYGEIKNI